MTRTEPAGGYDPLASAGEAGSAAGPNIRIASTVTGEEEIDAVRDVLESGILTNGPWTRRFEAAMADRHGTEHAVALANGTIALAAMYLAVGIEPGDEIIVPSLTFIGTATSVLHVGAVPVFADVLADTLTLDPSDVARRMTPRTKAIVPVHYGGQAADLDRLRDLADEAGVVLLEDAAQAHGASFGGRPVGSWGQAAMFSFTPTKNITTGEGAVVTTNDGDLAQTIRLLRNHGMSRQYFHEMVGYNWRLSEMQAAIGTVQLDRLDDILVAKRANADTMSDLLGADGRVHLPGVRPDRDHPYMLYTVRIPGFRDVVLGALDEAGIESRIYFPSCHRQPIFEHLPDPELPVTDQLAEEILSLPVHTRLAAADLRTISETVLGALG